MERRFEKILSFLSNFSSTEFGKKEENLAYNLLIFKVNMKELYSYKTVILLDV